MDMLEVACGTLCKVLERPAAYALSPNTWIAHLPVLTCAVQEVIGRVMQKPLCSHTFPYPCRDMLNSWSN